MIITRTPFRVSFFGGGTDYPAWYRENGGAVLSTTINKYCYINCRYLPPFFENKSKIVWSKIENVKNHDDIEHPAARGVIQFLNINDGVEIHHHADLPARSGLGSSSSFTVGLLHALHALKGRMMSKLELAKTAIHVEQNILKENVGSQDQIAAAFGGFNKIEFGGDDFHITPIVVKPDRLQAFRDRLMLVFTGFSRNASEIAAEQIKTIPQKNGELTTMHAMVDEALAILNSDQSLSEFGKLLHESWLLKRSLSHRVSTTEVDQIYEMARNAGATGGKILGAGGGGFMMFFIEPDRRPMVKKKLAHLLEVPFDFETTGSHMIFYDPAEVR